MAKDFSRRFLYWILASGLLILLTCWLLFSYRYVLIQSVINAAGSPYHIEVVKLDGLTFNDGKMKLESLEVRQLQSHFVITNTSLSLNQHYLPQALNVEHVRLKLDYQSIIWLTQQRQTTKPEPKFDLSQLPSVELALLELELTNFPEQWLEPNLRNVELTAIKLIPGEQFSASAALAVNQRPLLDLKAQFNLQSFSGSINAQLANLTELVRQSPRYNTLLPTQAKVTGQASFDVSWLDTDRERLTVAAQASELAVSSLSTQKLISLIEGINVDVRSALSWHNGLQLMPFDFKVEQARQLLLNQDRCQQWLTLFAQPMKWCEPLVNTGELSIKLSEVAVAQLVINPQQLTDWRLASEALKLDVVSSQQQLQLQLINTKLSAKQLTSRWQLNGSTVGIEGIKLAKIELAGQLTKKSQLSLAIAQAKIILSQVKLPQTKVEQLTISSKAPFELVINKGEISPVTTRWYSRTKRLTAAGITLPFITASHRVKLSGRNLSGQKLDIHSDWRSNEIKLSSSNHILLKNYQPISFYGRWRLPEQALQPLLALKPELNKLWPPALLLAPRVSQVIDYQGRFKRGRFRLSAKVQGQLSAEHGSYNDLILDGLSSQWQCQLELMQQLQGDCQSDIELASLDVGFAISKMKISGRLSKGSQRITLTLDHAKGELLDGTFKVKPVVVRDFDDMNFSVVLADISLATLVELQQQPGITATGLLGGQLPIRMTKQQVSISGGKLINQPPGGVIQIRDNENVNQLRLSQPQLGFVLDALEDLQYSQLTGELDYQTDGLAIIKVAIEGRNPEFKRPIEFNYSHQENILQLLRSLRIGDEITQKIEKIAQ